MIQWLRREAPTLTMAALVGTIHFVSHGSISAGPFIIGALIDHRGYSAGEAGFVTMLELLSFAIATTIISTRVDRLSIRHVGYASAILGILACLGSVVAVSPMLFAVSRCVGGAAGGLLYACACATGARSPNPGRTYSFGYALTTLLYAVHWQILAAALGYGSISGAYMYMAVQLGIVILVCRWLPAGQKAGSRSSKQAQAVSNSGHRQILLLTAMTGFCFGSVALWGFTERLGVQAGLPTAQVAQIQGLTTLIAIVGTLMPAWIIPRTGPRVMCVAAILVTAVSCFGLTLVHGPMSYFFVMLLYFGAFNAGYVSLMTYSALLDRTGGTSAAAGAMLLFAWAAGAGVGGAAAEFAGYAVLAYAGTITCIAALIPLWMVSAAPRPARSATGAGPA